MSCRNLVQKTSALVRQLVNLLGLCVLLTQGAHALPLGVDLRDVVAFAPGQWPDLEAIAADIQSRTSTYVRSRRFSREGVTKLGRAHELYGIELAHAPLAAMGGGYWYNINITSSSMFAGAHKLRLHKFSVLVQQGVVESIEQLPTSGLARDRYKITVSLFDQTLTVQGARSGYVKVYPVTVGMIDPGVTPASLRRNVVVTPLYQNAKIVLGLTTAEATGLFRDRPFMPFVNSRGQVQNIAFHANSNLNTPVNTIERGFVSSGCIRLREKDLYELFDLLQTVSAGQISVEVVALQQEAVPHTAGLPPSVHPYPYIPNYYAVRNAGTAEHPEVVRSIPSQGRRPLRQALRMSSSRPELDDLTFLDEEMMTPEERTEYSIPFLMELLEWEELNSTARV